MIKLKGFEELSRKLNQIESKVSRSIVRKGTAKMAQVVRKEMRAKAPRKTGKLKKELRYKIRRKTSGGFTAEVGAFNGAYYAKFIEKGTKMHKIRAGSKRKVLSFRGRTVSEVEHPGISAKPFIEPAFKAAKDRAVKEAGIKIMQEITKIL